MSTEHLRGMKVKSAEDLELAKGLAKLWYDLNAEGKQVFLPIDGGIDMDAPAREEDLLQAIAAGELDSFYHRAGRFDRGEPAASRQRWLDQHPNYVGDERGNVYCIYGKGGEQPPTVPANWLQDQETVTQALIGGGYLRANPNVVPLHANPLKQGLPDDSERLIADKQREKRPSTGSRTNETDKDRSGGRRGLLECDREMAGQHLALLDPTATDFTFQTFTDNAGLKAKLRSKRKEENELAQQEGQKSRQILDPLANVFNGTLEQWFDKLAELNNQGAGVFVTVNRTDLKGRRTGNITHIRAIWNENDKGFLGEYLIEPSFTVHTSEGKQHDYFLVDEPWEANQEGLADFASIMACMVGEYGSDPNAKDAARVLRLAGFYHRKQEPQLVELVMPEGKEDVEVYTRERLVQAFSPKEPVTREAKRDPNEGVRPYSLRAELELRSALRYVKTDSYSEWVRKAMAFKRLGWDDELGSGPINFKDSNAGANQIQGFGRRACHDRSFLAERNAD